MNVSLAHPESGRERQRVLEHATCLCGDPGPAPAYVEVRDEYSGEVFTYRKCPRCGLEYVSPRPRQADMARYYPTHYYAYSPGNVRSERLLGAIGRLVYYTYYAPPAERPGAVRLLRCLLWVLLWPIRRRPLLAFCPPAGRKLFEFGSAVGNDLCVFRAAGWEVAGCEPSAEACRIARLRGLDVRHCAAEDVVLPERSVSCIVMNNVFEHLYDPPRVLATCRDALEDGGKLVLVVPNHDSVLVRMRRGEWPGHDAPRHLWGFTPASLAGLLQANGFDVDYVAHQAPFVWYWQGVLLRWFSQRRLTQSLRSLSSPLGLLLVPVGCLVAWFGHGFAVKLVARKAAQSLIPNPQSLIPNP